MSMADSAGATAKKAASSSASAVTSRLSNTMSGDAKPNSARKTACSVTPCPTTAAERIIGGRGGFQTSIINDPMNAFHAKGLADLLKNPEFRAAIENRRRELLREHESELQNADYGFQQQ